ncbi:MAG: hypothetical protein ACPLKP_00910 [Microgenomates group bacterium]
MRKNIPADLKNLVDEYILWLKKKEKIEKRLDGLKEAIIAKAKKEKIKKISTDDFQVLIISQSETRFPQINEPGRKELEKIVKESKELEKVMVFDIVALGNLYDQKKLSAELMEKLKPFAKQVKTTKLVIRPFSKTDQKILT